MGAWLCSSRDPAVSSDLTSWTTLLVSDYMLLVECLWDVDPCRLLSLGSDPVSSLLGLEDSVWASCANQVAVIQESSLQTQVEQVSSRDH